MASSATGRMEGDVVRLRLPGDPGYGRLARIAALGLARRIGLPFRQREDLALAVDETVILLLQTSEGRPPLAGLEVELAVVDGGIVLSAEPVADDVERPPLPGPLRERFELLVGATVADWSLDDAARRVVLRTGAPTG